MCEARQPMADVFVAKIVGTVMGARPADDSSDRIDGLPFPPGERITCRSADRLFSSCVPGLARVS
jgi:hypothetical protein